MLRSCGVRNADLGGNPSGSQELQHEDKGVPLSLWYQSHINSVKNKGTSQTFLCSSQNARLFG